MTEKNALKMNLDHERKIVELQSRVNKLENLCYMTKEVLNLEEASAFLGIAKSTLYKMTHLNQLPYFKPAGKLIFFEKKALLDWVRGARAMSEEEIRLEAANRLNEMNNMVDYISDRFPAAYPSKEQTEAVNTYLHSVYADGDGTMSERNCEHRRIASQKITINAIQVLDSPQLDRLQRVLDHIAYDKEYYMPERGFGMRR